MDWMRQYSYIAAWLSPVIALVGMLIRGGAKGSSIDWARMMLYIGFLTCLAAVFTPVLENASRVFAGFVVGAVSIFFMCQGGLDAGVRRQAERKEKGLPPPPPMLTD
jgi:hypothetical protein